MMPSGQFYTVVISVSDIFPLDKGHYISARGRIHGLVNAPGWVWA